MLSVLLACSATGIAQAATPLPVVGCAADGQNGPQAAPAAPKSRPQVPDAAAGKLAYYVTADNDGVLAPRGWRCFSLYGSNGSTLIVTPEKHGQDLFDGKTKLTGPAVQLSVSFSETSGRFEAARLAALLFPSKKAFVEQVANEGILPKSDFRAKPFPGDTMKRDAQDKDIVEYRTAAKTEGLGTKSRLVPNDQPIDGLALATSNNDVVKLDVRLGAGQQDLVEPILDALRRAKTSYEGQDRD